MSRAIQELPPAPRAVRWRAVMGCAWPLLFLGFVLGIYGGAIGVMFLFHRQGKAQDDADLDRAGTVVHGKVVDILPIPRTPPHGQLQRVEHEFVIPFGASKFGPLRQRGSSFVSGRNLAIGDRVDIEFVASRPEVSRIAGGKISLAPDPFDFHLRYVLMPGLACLVLWSWFVLRARRLLTLGDVAAGDVLAVRRVPVCIPDMVRVHYSFRDRTAQLRTGTHWIRAHGRLMQWIDAFVNAPHAVIVVHDRKNPRHSRLAVPDDFRAGRASHEPQPEESSR